LFELSVRGLALPPSVIGALCPAGLGAPETSPDHDLPDAFRREGDTMVLAQLLAGERGFEICIAGFKNAESFGYERIG
jgi:hypothetical protein